MRSAFLLPLLVGVVACAPRSGTGGPAGALTSLDEFAWERRILLVRVPPAEVEGVAARLEAARPELEDRDLVWFLFGAGTPRTNHRGPLAPALSREIEARGLLAETPSLALLGKDGGVKLRAATLSLTDIYACIDAMPMRRAEMRRR